MGWPGTQCTRKPPTGSLNPTKKVTKTAQVLAFIFLACGSFKFWPGTIFESYLLMEYWSTNSKYVLSESPMISFFFLKNGGGFAGWNWDHAWTTELPNSPRTKMINGIYKSLFEDATSQGLTDLRRPLHDFRTPQMPTAARHVLAQHFCHSFSASSWSTLNCFRSKSKAKLRLQWPESSLKKASAPILYQQDVKEFLSQK